MEEFDQALQGLQNGAMKPNPQLLEQMRQLDLKNLAELTPEQLEQLRENLQKNADNLKKCQGQGEGQGEDQGEDWSDELLADEGDEGEGGEPGEGPGKGGVERGPGHSPGVLGGEKDALYDQAVEVVLKNRKASISLVQRHLKIGYNRAARLVEDMEKAGLVSAMSGSGQRDILVPARAE